MQESDCWLRSSHSEEKFFSRTDQTITITISLTDHKERGIIGLVSTYFWEGISIRQSQVNQVSKLFWLSQWVSAVGDKAMQWLDFDPTKIDSSQFTIRVVSPWKQEWTKKKGGKEDQMGWKKACCSISYCRCREAWLDSFSHRRPTKAFSNRHNNWKLWSLLLYIILCFSHVYPFQTNCV